MIAEYKFFKYLFLQNPEKSVVTFCQTIYHILSYIGLESDG
jgi:hypothetical protein